MKSLITRKKLMIFCFFIIISIIIAYVFVLQPPYVYRGDTRYGCSYDAAVNRSYSEGEGNWEIEYILTVHDGSPIEVLRSFKKGRQNYAETNDIGRMRLTPKNCPYVDDIVSARYQVDWLRADPFYSGGCLDPESGFFFWEDGMPVIDGYAYRNDISKFRKVECELSFLLKDGRSVREWAVLYLRISKKTSGMVPEGANRKKPARRQGVTPGTV